VDSVFCHANWACSLGGVSFPLLADFHPKGAVASSLGVYLDDDGITDRATVIVDASGIVRYAESVTPAGRRDMEQLLEVCRKLDAEELPAPAPPDELGEAELYVKSSCGFSRAVLLARDNLHLADALPVKNVSEDAAARSALVERAGKDQAPALVAGGRVVQDSKAIIELLAACRSPL